MRPGRAKAFSSARGASGALCARLCSGSGVQWAGKKAAGALLGGLLVNSRGGAVSFCCLVQSFRSAAIYLACIRRASSTAGLAGAVLLGLRGAASASAFSAFHAMYSECLRTASRMGCGAFGVGYWLLSPRLLHRSQASLYV